MKHRVIAYSLNRFTQQIDDTTICTTRFRILARLIAAAYFWPTSPALGAYIQSYSTSEGEK